MFSCRKIRIFSFFWKHPKQPPPPPPQIQSRSAALAAAAASRAILNRSIQQPLNVSTISHQTAPSIVLTPNKLIPNGHANGGLRIPTAVPSQILNTTPLTSCSSQQNHSCSLQMNAKHRLGAREALTSLGLLCLGTKINKFSIFIAFKTNFSQFCFSFVAASAIIVNFLIENFAKWSWAAATTTRSNCKRRLYNCLRCYACTVCIILIFESMLPARLCNPIFVCC